MRDEHTLHEVIAILDAHSHATQQKHYILRAKKDEVKGTNTKQRRDQAKMEELIGSSGNTIQIHQCKRVCACLWIALLLFVLCVLVSIFL